MFAPGFDLIDIEFRYNVRQEVFQIHSWRGSIVVFVLSAGDEIAERIGSDGNSFARRGGKLQAGHRASSNGRLQTRPPEHRCSCGGGGLRKKMPSCNELQSGASLAECAWQTRVKRIALV